MAPPSPTNQPKLADCDTGPHPKHLLTMGWYAMLVPPFLFRVWHMEQGPADKHACHHVSAKRCSNSLNGCMTLHVSGLSSKSSCSDLEGAKPARLPFPDSFGIPKWSIQQRPAHDTQTPWWWRFDKICGPWINHDKAICDWFRPKMWQTWGSWAAQRRLNEHRVVTSLTKPSFKLLNLKVIRRWSFASSRKTRFLSMHNLDFWLLPVLPWKMYDVHQYVPVVPHRAVAEVSRIRNL